MKPRFTHTVVAVVALLVFLIAFGGSGIAAKPAKSGLKSGVNKVKTKDTSSTTLSDLRATLSANRTGRVDAKLGTGTLKLAKLSNVTIDAQNKTVSAKVALTAQAVAAINSAFGTAFPSGIVLGTVVIAPTF
jgi:fructose/tagatose bisphosphate aldolase